MKIFQSNSKPKHHRSRQTRRHDDLHLLDDRQEQDRERDAVQKRLRDMQNVFQRLPTEEDDSMDIEDALKIAEQIRMLADSLTGIGGTKHHENETSQQIVRKSSRQRRPKKDVGNNKSVPTNSAEHRREASNTLQIRTLESPQPTPLRERRPSPTTITKKPQEEERQTLPPTSINTPRGEVARKIQLMEEKWNKIAKPSITDEETFPTKASVALDKIASKSGDATKTTNVIERLDTTISQATTATQKGGQAEGSRSSSVMALAQRFSRPTPVAPPPYPGSQWITQSPVSRSNTPGRNIPGKHDDRISNRNNSSNANGKNSQVFDDKEQANLIEIVSSSSSGNPSQKENNVSERRTIFRQSKDSARSKSVDRNSNKSSKDGSRSKSVPRFNPGTNNVYQKEPTSGRAHGSHTFREYADDELPFSPTTKSGRSSRPQFQSPQSEANRPHHKRIPQTMDDESSESSRTEPTAKNSRLAECKGHHDRVSSKSGRAGTHNPSLLETGISLEDEGPTWRSLHDVVEEPPNRAPVDEIVAVKSSKKPAEKYKYEKQAEWDYRNPHYAFDYQPKSSTPNEQSMKSFESTVSSLSTRSLRAARIRKKIWKMICGKMSHEPGLMLKPSEATIGTSAENTARGELEKKSKRTKVPVRPADLIRNHQQGRSTSTPTTRRSSSPRKSMSYTFTTLLDELSTRDLNIVDNFRQRASDQGVAPNDSAGLRQSNSNVSSYGRQGERTFEEMNVIPPEHSPHMGRSRKNRKENSFTPENPGRLRKSKSNLSSHRRHEAGNFEPIRYSASNISPHRGRERNSLDRNNRKGFSLSPQRANRSISRTRSKNGESQQRHSVTFSQNAKGSGRDRTSESGSDEEYHGKRTNSTLHDYYFPSHRDDEPSSRKTGILPEISSDERNERMDLSVQQSASVMTDNEDAKSHASMSNFSGSTGAFSITELVKYMSFKDNMERGFEILLSDSEGFRKKYFPDQWSSSDKEISESREETDDDRQPESSSVTDDYRHAVSRSRTMTPTASNIDRHGIAGSSNQSISSTDRMKALLATLETPRGMSKHRSPKRPEDRQPSLERIRNNASFDTRRYQHHNIAANSSSSSDSHKHAKLRDLVRE